MIEESPDASVIASEFDCVVVGGFCPMGAECWIAGHCVRSRPNPDARQPARKKDVAAIRSKLLRTGWCYSCDRRASDGHHIVWRSSGGDDVEENIAPLCHDCHMLLHFAVGEDADTVRRQIGETLLTSEYGEIEYALRRLGLDAGTDYLVRRYHMTAAGIVEFMAKLPAWRETDGDPED